MTQSRSWLTAADAQAAATLMFDSLVNLSLLSGLLLQFGFPEPLLTQRILPGSAVAVLLGSLGSAFLAARLRARTGRNDVTAVPFGLDTPSTLGMALGVLGPAFVAARADARLQGLGPAEAADVAAQAAWHLGSAVMVLIGVLKGGLALVAPHFDRWLPAAASMGALGGIGLMFLGLLPMLEVFSAPLVGLPALVVVLVGLVARRRLPFALPPAALAVAVGCASYYGLGPWGAPGVGAFAWPHGSLAFTPPLWVLPGAHDLAQGVVALSVAVPFALLTVVGGISNVAGARAAGDAFRVRSLLWTDAVATIVAGCMGGVAQSTPYIGHAAYKRMGARSGYVLLSGMAVGLGGAIGAVHLAIDALPLAAIAPVMVYVGLEISGHTFAAVPARHVPAVLLAFLPTLANLLLLRCEAVLAEVQKALAVALSPAPAYGVQAAATVAHALRGAHLQTLRMLGHGFLLTSLLWASALAQLIDGRARRAAVPLLVLAALTPFGVVHSPKLDGGLFWPSQAPCVAVWATSAAYALAALLAVALQGGRRARAAGPHPQAP